MAKPTCSIPGCTRSALARRLCGRHYQQYRKAAGDSFQPIVPADIMTRFWSYTDQSGGPDACWLWTGTIEESGYGDIFVNGGKPRLQKAHRFAYERLVGPIPDGLEIDHTCHTKECPTPGDGDLHRRCVNPQHLEAVDRPTNVQRSTAPEATRAYYQENVAECPKGHPYDEENTQWRTTKDGYKSRRCAQCNRDNRARWSATRPAKPKQPRALPDRCKRGHLYTETDTRVRMKNGKPVRECRVCDREDATAKRAKLKAETGLTHPSRAKRQRSAAEGRPEQGLLWSDVA